MLISITFGQYKYYYIEVIRIIKIATFYNFSNINLRNDRLHNSSIFEVKSEPFTWSN